MALAVLQSLSPLAVGPTPLLLFTLHSHLAPVQSDYKIPPI